MKVGLKVFNVVRSKRLDQIAVFLNQLYLKERLMNQLDFRHADIDSGNMKISMKIFS